MEKNEKTCFNAETNNFNQRTACRAPLRLSKQQHLVWAVTRFCGRWVNYGPPWICCDFLLIIFYYLIYQVVSCEDYLFDYIGGDIEPNDYPKVDSAFDCQKKCKENQNCNFWTWGMKTHESSNVAAICFLKKDVTSKIQNNHTISGPKYCRGKSLMCIFFG